MNPWSTAVPDWRERIMSGTSLVPKLPLFQPSMERGLRALGLLRLPDVVGQPRMLEACGPWYFDIAAALFGSYDPVARERMIKEFFLLVPKGNAKTSYGGLLMLAALIVNERPNAEFYFVAPTQTIAKRAFDIAAQSIALDSDLDDALHATQHNKAILNRNSGAVLLVKSADTKVSTGGKQLGTMIDETHELSKSGSASHIFIELRGALRKNPDGFLIQTTTQAKTKPAGVFAAELKKAREVRDGLQELPLLPILYELPDDVAANGGWKNPAYWGCVNPNLGRSVKERELHLALKEAEIAGPAELALTASQHFNVQIGQTQTVDGWIGADFWLGNEKEDVVNVDLTLTLESLLERSDVVVVGIDGGGLDDLLGLAILGRDRLTGDWLLWAHAWAHEIVLSRRKSEEPIFRDFERDEDLTIVKFPGEDVVEVADIIMRIDAMELLPEQHAVGVDEIGVREILRALDERGFDTSAEAKRVVGISQGYRLMPAIKEAERGLAAGRIKHAGRAMMGWAVGNAKVEPKGNAIMVTKAVSGTAKIDPLMAAFNAVFLMAANPNAVGRSYLATADEIVVLD